ncbi:MAG: anaerobic ribonucleoside-triphosphate reductase activating protein [Ruminococcus sp.]|nr:anaerobic ribonucleoside-triphosphate reductase activating protein [Ruminococcus sp.]
MGTKLNLSGVVSESIVDGPGIRMTIFTQGCPHHCKGCHNPETWAFEPRHSGDVDKILSIAVKNKILQGMTFSGGEPFCQAAELAELAQKCRENGLNVMSYSGYTFEELVAGSREKPEWMELLKNLDYLVDGPYIEEQRSLMLLFRGSKNQRFLDVPESLKQGKAVPVNEETLYDGTKTREPRVPNPPI